MNVPLDVIEFCTSVIDPVTVEPFCINVSTIEPKPSVLESWPDHVPVRLIATGVPGPIVSTTSLDRPLVPHAFFARMRT